MDKKIAKIVLVVITVLLVAGITAWFLRDSIIQFAMKPTDTTLKTIDTDNIPNPDPNAPLETVIAENLKIPWEIAFLPDGSMLVTERTGTIEKISPDRKTIAQIEGVSHIGEGGLLGMALHPDHSKNHLIYLYLTSSDGTRLTNRIESYKLENGQLSNRKVILSNIPGSRNHDGGRIAFDSNGYLFIATGDAETTTNAQDKNSLAGKILRIKDDGSIPKDNPFGNAVYSYGHRNPQGLAWDSLGRLWATEHGPSGSQTGNDELNLIEKGKNYGWPVIKGGQTKEGLVTPIANSGDHETWAPAGLAYYKGLLIFTGLRGQSLYAGKIQSGNSVALTSYLRNKYGRLRAIAVGPDGFIYISTSNTDGRGKSGVKDDKIIRLSPRIFEQN